MNFCNSDTQPIQVLKAGGGDKSVIGVVATRTAGG
jgi:hypothetical protein